MLDVFIGRQNIKNLRLDDDGNVSFDVSVPGTETKKTPAPRFIARNDLENLYSFFTGTLQSCPFSKHLLQILWFREVKFAMGALKDEEVYSFIRKTIFALYKG